MSWRRSTLSGRRVAVATTLVLTAGIAVPAVAARTHAPTPAQVVTEPADDAPSPPPPVGTPAPRAAITEGLAPDTGAEPAEGAPKRRRTVLDDRELAAARQVAADFGAEYATYRFDEPPEAAAARLLPWTTPELAEQLAANTGGAAGRAQLVERQQVAEAQVETVTVQRVDGQQLDILVVVAQKLTWRGGSDTRWPSYLTRVTRSTDGWRVAALQP
jgi:hypothetical protein